jgi:speckle-type POZ protein
MFVFYFDWPVFASMFPNDIESKTNEVEIADVEPAVLKALLEFIYTGHCVVTNVVEELFRASDKYDIKDLKEICEHELLEKITVDNAVHLLILSDLYQAKKLKESVTIFINCCAADVMEKPSWNKLMDSYPRLVGELYMRLAPKREEK